MGSRLQQLFAFSTRAVGYSTNVAAAATPPLRSKVTCAANPQVSVTSCGSDLQYNSSSLNRPCTFPGVFLRDNCSRSIHPTTMQRLVPVWELPHDLAISAAHVNTDSRTVSIEWNDDSDPSSFTFEWLEAHRLDSDNDGAHRIGNKADALELKPWRPSELPSPGVLPNYSFPLVMKDDTQLLLLLDAICTLGVARITGIEDDADAGSKLAQRIGHARQTVFGNYFEVKVEENANNQAYTANGR